MNDINKIKASLSLPIAVGDEILTGHWMNHKEKVKTIGEDKHGQPTVNGRPILRVRIPKLMGKTASADQQGWIDPTGEFHRIPLDSHLAWLRETGAFGLSFNHLTLKDDHLSPLLNVPWGYDEIYDHEDMEYYDAAFQSGWVQVNSRDNGWTAFTYEPENITPAAKTTVMAMAKDAMAIGDEVSIIYRKPGSYEDQKEFGAKNKIELRKAFQDSGLVTTAAVQETLTLPWAPDAPVFKNPGEAELEFLRDRYTAEVGPRSIADDTPRIRHTYDQVGNEWAWMALDGGHQGVEDFLELQHGGHYHQNQEWALTAAFNTANFWITAGGKLLADPEYLNDILTVFANDLNFDGAGGNCGVFAVALNQFLGGGGTYVMLVEESEPEYYSHVALKIGGKLWDYNGLTTRKAIRDSGYAEPGESVSFITTDDPDNVIKYTQPTNTVEDLLAGLNKAKALVDSKKTAAFNTNNFWITADGELIDLPPEQTHADYAIEYVLKDPNYSHYPAQVVYDKTFDRGWIRALGDGQDINLQFNHNATTDARATASDLATNTLEFDGHIYVDYQGKSYEAESPRELRRVLKQTGLTAAKAVLSADFSEDLAEALSDAPAEVLEEYTNSPQTPQEFRVLPAARLKKIYRDFAKLGFVRDEAGINQFQDIIFTNVVKLYGNTVLAGHTPHSADEEFTEAGMPEEKDRDAFYDWLEDHYSDYGMDPLIDALSGIIQESDYTKKFIAIDHLLNITHQRSDLAKLFVEGGTDTLNEISSRPSNNEVISALDLTPFEYQNTNQERVIHSRWDKGNNYRYVLEGTGDIFRELALGKADDNYVGEKIDRLLGHIAKERSGKLHPEDTFDMAKAENADKFDLMISQWVAQPATTELQEQAVVLNLAMLHGAFVEAETVAHQIDAEVSGKIVAKAADPRLLAKAKEYATADEFIKGFYREDWSDELAFGYKNGVQPVDPKLLNIKWDIDYYNAVPYDVPVETLPPVDVSYENNQLYLEDGHHRLKMAIAQGKPLMMDLTIMMSPLPKLGLESDDDLKRIWQQAHAVTAGKQTDSPEFKAWFGDSRAVDSEGQPLVCYHGSRSTFNVFDDKRFNSGSFDGGWLGRGFYFTPNKAYAESYAEGDNASLVGAYLLAKTPYVADGYDYSTEPKKLAQELGAENSEEIRTILKSKGYDSVIHTEYGEIVEVMVFDPKQIKSATSNAGRFDPSNPDITAAVTAGFYDNVEGGWIDPQGQFQDVCHYPADDQGHRKYCPITHAVWAAQNVLSDKYSDLSETSDRPSRLVTEEVYADMFAMGYIRMLSLDPQSVEYQLTAEASAQAKARMQQDMTEAIEANRTVYMELDDQHLKAANKPEFGAMMRQLNQQPVMAKKTSAPTTLTLYHGTPGHNVPGIQDEGLKNPLDSAGWFMLADHEEDAIFHAKSVSGDPQLITFTVPCDNEDWVGAPYLWPPAKAGHGLWYAPRGVLSATFITAIRPIAEDELENATLGYKKPEAVLGGDSAIPFSDTHTFSGTVVAYHGTAKEFPTFDPTISELGVHFSASPVIARERGSRVIQVELHFNNAYESGTDLGKWDDLEVLRTYFKNQVIFTAEEVSSWASWHDTQQSLIAKGYDGIIYYNTFEGGGVENTTCYIVFNNRTITVLDSDFKEIRRSKPTLVKDILDGLKTESAKDKPEVFLGGEVKTDWRTGIIDEFKDTLKLIDPVDPDWTAEENIYSELAQALEADEVIFFKGGEGTAGEKQVLDAAGKEYEEFDDLEELVDRLERLGSSDAEFGGWILPDGQYVDTEGVEHRDFLLQNILNQHQYLDTTDDGRYWQDYAHDEGYVRFRSSKFGIDRAVLEFGKIEQVSPPALQTGLAMVKDAVWAGKTAEIEFFGSSPAVYEIHNKIEFGRAEREIMGRAGVQASLTTTAAYDNGCLMIDIPTDLQRHLLKELAPQIPLDSLVTDKEETLNGVESQGHVTVLYGVDDNMQTWEVVRQLFTKPLVIKSGTSFGYFDNEETACYVPVESEDLTALHYALRAALPNKQHEGDYKPHVTLAYLKPGERLPNLKVEPFEWRVTKIIFSKPDGSTEDIYIDGLEPEHEAVEVLSAVADEWFEAVDKAIVPLGESRVRES